uniref:Putative ectoine synthase n=1 Tax=Magnetococcus massalia (strain MO-1) TaxID=451514 RepID=A0A1S7LKU5_MAGMO|nr:putative ectoine synthase [Candidatus Magnetococcus massalia]
MLTGPFDTTPCHRWPGTTFRPPFMKYPGYGLNGYERHNLRAMEGVRMTGLFTPALIGQESHDENGLYPLLTEEDGSSGKEQTSTLRAWWCRYLIFFWCR